MQFVYLHLESSKKASNLSPAFSSVRIIRPPLRNPYSR